MTRLVVRSCDEEGNVFFEVSRKNQDGVWILEIVGDFHLRCESEIPTPIGPRFIYDLCRVTSMDTFGEDLIMKMLLGILEAGGRASVVCAFPRRYLQELGENVLFTDSLDKALSFVKGDTP